MADLLSTREVQDILSVDRTTIYRMAENGQLPAIRVGKQWRFERAALARWLDDAGAAMPVATKPASAGGLAQLLPGRSLQMMQDLYADALGATIVVTDMDGRPLTQVSNPCGLYTAVLDDADAVARCIQDWQRMAGTIPLEPRFSPNDLGLLCTRGLIRVGNVLTGMVFLGGIAPEVWPPSDPEVADMAAHFGLAREELAVHLPEVFHMDRRQRERVLAFVQRIADVISQILEERRG